jgi:hypothetical protein
MRRKVWVLFTATPIARVRYYIRSKKSWQNSYAKTKGATYLCENIDKEVLVSMVKLINAKISIS